MKFMKTKIFCVMVLCTGLLVGCDKERDEYEPVKPPVEQPEEPDEPEQPEKPEKPVIPPSTNNIIKTKIGDINMIVGTYAWNDIAYGNGRYVAVGGGNNTGGYVTSSTDGTNWTTPKKISGVSNKFSFVTYANGKFFAVGDAGVSISTSYDGINWTDAKRIASDKIMNDIIYANGMYVMVGWNGYLMTSPDGDNWKTISVGYATSSYVLNRVIYHGGKFIAVGEYGMFSTSTDGKTWTQMAYIDFSNTYDCKAIASNGEKIVVVNRNGYFSTSVDGVTWTKFKYMGVYLTQVNNLVYSNGKFVAIGMSYVDNEDLVYTATSVDGEIWTALEPIKDESGIILPESKRINAVCIMP